MLSISAAVVQPAGARSPVGGVTDPVATSSRSVCPSGRNPYDLHLWIHVMRWCDVRGVRDQMQFKIQMKIHNKSQDHGLDITQGTIRLVVHEFDPDRWSPGSIGQATLDRPVQTHYRGEVVWAIPADADGAYDVLPSGVPTFATHWGFTSLPPGGTLHPHRHYGDLVFEVPMPRRHGVIGNVVGVAYVKGPDIIALCPPETWVHHSPANSF